MDSGPAGLKTTWLLHKSGLDTGVRIREVPTVEYFVKYFPFAYNKVFNLSLPLQQRPEQ